MCSGIKAVTIFPFPAAAKLKALLNNEGAQKIIRFDGQMWNDIW